MIISSSSMEPQEEAKQSGHSCDYCDSSVALLYCKADSAKLCLACDKEVHSTNQLFAKHFRSLLCDSCHDSPASVFCETKHSVLCQNCDWERHSSSSRCGGASGSSSVHSRRPVEGFSGCPSVTELLAIVGLDDLSDKSLFLNDGERFTESGVGGPSELLLWETPEILCLNDLIASGGSGHNFRAMDIPHLPKNRHATCGKHKDEMIRQLRELSRSESSCLKYESLDNYDDNGFQFLAPDNNLFPTFEVSGMKRYEGNAEEHQEDEEFSYFSLLRNLTESEEKACVVVSENVNHLFPEESSLIKTRRCEEETVMVPVCSTNTTTKSTTTLHEINSLERNSALSRYKEKKKWRRYEKHIRYESRKVRAESRTRIRGRFAKADP